jgi:hypothetical protein
MAYTSSYNMKPTQKTRDITFSQHKLVEWGDTVYGVGILNVTEDEMRILRDVAYRLQNNRRIAARGGERMDRITLPLYGQIDPDAFLEGARQPEPDEPPDPIGDRFAGLDFGEDKK